jgi:Ca2+-binding EF-hand superfamily protein
MKQHTFVLAVVLLAAAAMSAQEPPRQGGPGGPGMRGVAIFQALDADHDNSLSAAEIDAASAGLKQLDKNGDGKVTADEFPPPRPAGPGRGGEGRGRGGSGIGDEAPAAPPTPDDLVTMLMAYDKNKDGKLTTKEVPERMQGVFARADTDHDAVLTADEIRKAAAAQPQPTSMRPEGRRGEGGPPRVDVLFTALDQDGDGAFSAEEITSAPASLRKLDTNGDGSLSLMEVLGGGRGRG